MFLSIVIPIRNEEKNLEELHKRIVKTCQDYTPPACAGRHPADAGHPSPSYVKTSEDKQEGTSYPFEVIYVENASTDNSLEILKKLKKAKVLVMQWQPYMRNAQSLAMDAGFKAAKGKYTIYMDGDLQVEPEEIPRFVKLLEEGYDAVSGWRVKRVETQKLDIFKPLKNVLRWIFTQIRKKLIHEQIHDPGSAIKGFRTEAIQQIDLYGEMHRYIMAILRWQGYKITEIKVKHHPRVYGKSHYNITKGFKGFADLINVFIWRKYSDRPLHLFGVGGLFIFAFGCFTLVVQLILRALELMQLSNSIFPILSVLLIITGLQLFLSGVVADNLSRISYYQSGEKPYKIREEFENI